MTIEIGQDRQQRALHPPVAAVEAAPSCSRLMLGIRIGMATSAVAGLILAGLDLSAPLGVRYSIYAAACFMTAGLGGALICLNAILADRREFYRRGQLDGWMKGWRGQEPDVDDPLLR